MLLYILFGQFKVSVPQDGFEPPSNALGDSGVIEQIEFIGDFKAKSP